MPLVCGYPRSSIISTWTMDGRYQCPSPLVLHNSAGERMESATCRSCGVRKAILKAKVDSVTVACCDQQPYVTNFPPTSRILLSSPSSFAASPMQSCIIAGRQWSFWPEGIARSYGEILATIQTRAEAQSRPLSTVSLTRPPAFAIARLLTFYLIARADRVQNGV